MARNLTEAKRYLVEQTKKYVRKMLPDYPIDTLEIIFHSQPANASVEYEIIYRPTPHIKEDMKVFFREKMVEANILNIENPYFTDLIVHELSHPSGSLKRVRSVIKGEKTRTETKHSDPEFRREYKKHAETTAIIGLSTPEEVVYHNAWTGGKWYGKAPDEMVGGTLRMCTNCGHIGLFDTLHD